MDAGAGVGDFEPEYTLVYSQAGPDPPAGRGKLEGVGQQVVQNLTALFLVEIGRQAFVRQYFK